MWKYSEITRSDFERRKDFVESVLMEFGAVPTNFGCLHRTLSYGNGISESICSDRTVFEYKRSYYRVDEVLFPEKPFIVIEYADNVEYVRNNVMEDTDPFPFDLSDKEIREEVKLMLG